MCSLYRESSRHFIASTRMSRLEIPGIIAWTFIVLVLYFLARAIYKSRFTNDRYSFERILFMHKITEYTIPHRRRMYKRFIAVPNIYRQVMRFVVEHDICNNVAIHVRRTDMELTHRRRSVTTDDEFYRFINSTSPHVWPTLVFLSLFRDTS